MRRATAENLVEPVSKYDIDIFSNLLEYTITAGGAA
jgi:hypothetical protein